jgi:hypothetical protein
LSAINKEKIMAAKKKKPSESVSDAVTRRYETTKSNRQEGLGNDLFYLETTKDKLTGKTSQTWVGTGKGKAIANMLNRKTTTMKAQRNVKKI